MKQPNTIELLIIVLATLIAVCSISGISVEGRKNSQPNYAIAPSAISAREVYLFSFSNLTGDDKLTFRISTDGGATFASKINLINKTLSNSTNVDLSSANQDIVISWWERNATIIEPEGTIHPENGITLGIILLRSPNETSIR